MLDIRKTKIVATIGPATREPEMLEKLVKAGVSIARLNFSHETQDKHLEMINNIKAVNKKLNSHVAIMADTKGPEVRLGVIENDSVYVEEGDIVSIVKKDVLGTNKQFTIAVDELYSDVEVGTILLVDDGKVRLTVLEKKADELICKVENPGDIKTRKGVNIPSVSLTMPFISKKDEEDIRFACQQNVDFLAVSFARRKEDILEVRAILEEEGTPNIQIIPKIENQEGMDNLREILEVSDGVMVARGDLGVEVSFEVVPTYQKEMIAIANEMGKPAITATHMLESMMFTPRPTNAEINDVYNAVFEGSDAVMLSGESAAGHYPIESIETMAKISKASEDNLPYADFLYRAKKTSEHTVQDSIGIAVADAALNLEKIKAIVVFTQSGESAKRISKFRPNAPILAVTFNEQIQRSLNCYWGVYPIFSEEMNDASNEEALACKVAKEFGLKADDQIVVVAGYPSGIGATNMMKIIDVK